MGHSEPTHHLPLIILIGLPLVRLQRPSMHLAMTFAADLSFAFATISHQRNTANMMTYHFTMGSVWVIRQDPLAAPLLQKSARFCFFAASQTMWTQPLSKPSMLEFELSDNFLKIQSKTWVRVSVGFGYYNTEMIKITDYTLTALTDSKL